MKWMKRSNIFTGTWFSSAQNSFILKFLVDFCDKIRRALTVLARFKMKETQNFLKKKFSVSLEKDFIFRFHIYMYIYIYVCFIVPFVSLISSPNYTLFFNVILNFILLIDDSTYKRCDDVLFNAMWVVQEEWVELFLACKYFHLILQPLQTGRGSKIKLKSTHITLYI